MVFSDESDPESARVIAWIDYCLTGPWIFNEEHHGKPVDLSDFDLNHKDYMKLVQVYKRYGWNVEIYAEKSSLIFKRSNNKSFFAWLGNLVN